MMTGETMMTMMMNRVDWGCRKEGGYHPQLFSLIYLLQKQLLVMVSMVVEVATRM